MHAKSRIKLVYLRSDQIKNSDEFDGFPFSTCHRLVNYFSINYTKRTISKYILP